MDKKKEAVIEYAVNQLVIAGALLVILTIASEFFLNLNPVQRDFLRVVDVCVVIVFAFDVFWHAYHAKNKVYYFQTHWLEVMAIIPVFELAKLGRLSEFAKLERVGEITRLENVDELVKVGRGIGSFEKINKVARGIVHERAALKTVGKGKIKY